MGEAGAMRAFLEQRVDGVPSRQKDIKGPEVLAILGTILMT